MYALAEVRWNQILRWGGTVRCSDSELFATARLEVLPVKSSSSSLQGGSKWGYLDNTKLFTFWICKIKQLNLRHFNTNSNNILWNSKFFPERSKNGCKKADIILFSISRSFRPFCENLFQISQGYRRFSKTVEDFLRLTKRSDHCRRCPKNPPNMNCLFASNFASSF